MTHTYAWGNNPKRATLKGRQCRILARGAMGSIQIEFENGQREIVSRRAVRKIKEVPKVQTELPLETAGETK